MNAPAKGMLVERLIEGLWFTAVIEDINSKHRNVTLKYLDDGNIEDAVSYEDVREISSNDLIAESKCEGKSGDAYSYLPKPLTGLIEDDYEIRKNHIPTVTVHNTSETDEAIILNGAENKLAAGGGLRALRYLKN